MKICSQCHVEKEEGVFRKNKRVKSDGSTVIACRPKCADCERIEQRIKNKELRERNPERHEQLKKYMRDWGKANPKPKPEQKIRKSKYPDGIKKCTKCLQEKPLCDFGLHKNVDRTGNYLNPNCKECAKLYAKNRYEKLKNDPEFKQENIARVRRYYHENLQRERYKLGIRRNTPEYKEYMRQWHKDNREQDRHLAKQRYVNYIADITPTYVKGVIKASFQKQGFHISYKEITDEMVKIKTKQIKSCRTQRKLNNLSKNQ